MVVITEFVEGTTLCTIRLIGIQYYSCPKQIIITIIFWKGVVEVFYFAFVIYVYVSYFGNLLTCLIIHIYEIKSSKNF